MREWDDLSPEEQEEVRRLVDQAEERNARDPAEIAAERNLPANRRFLPLYQQLIGPLTHCFAHDGEYASFDELRDTAALLFEQDLRPSRSLQSAFDIFEDVAGGDDARSHDLRYAVTCLLLAALSNTADDVARTAERERASLKGLSARNHAIALASDRARAIAAELWEQDLEQAIRIGDMAQRVWAAMIDEGLSDQMPEQADRLKVWIKPVAPAYATKGGRTKKPPRT
ncbi:hypothetical protein [Pseudomonas oryzihabitans]|uniref:hypothetical protein n=1 Tax=Pseudomonas oryzihabitans TaxID=47885 RepID=UPI002895BBCD|nr:hypothetical protein [Pseudomonas oryzihabitans]MDT3722373.1 hypothetical protein [Pseudomonas oryzihabitans]